MHYVLCANHVLIISSFLRWLIKLFGLSPSTFFRGDLLARTVVKRVHPLPPICWGEPFSSAAGWQPGYLNRVRPVVLRPRLATGLPFSQRLQRMRPRYLDPDRTQSCCQEQRPLFTENSRRVLLGNLQSYTRIPIRYRGVGKWACSTKRITEKSSSRKVGFRQITFSQTRKLAEMYLHLDC